MVKRYGSGFAIVELGGKIVADETAFGKSLSLDDVEAWIKEYIRPKPRQKA